MKKQNKKKISQYESCILCGKNTGILQNTPVWGRQNYIEGCGQLCEECARKLCSQSKNPKDF